MGTVGSTICTRTHTHEDPYPQPARVCETRAIPYLCVLLPTVAVIVQETLSIYTLWECHFDAVPESGQGQSAVGDCAGDNAATSDTDSYVKETLEPQLIYPSS